MLGDFIKVKGGFVKAVEITHDFRDSAINRNKIENYFVNPSALAALRSVAKGLHPSARQRVHLISGTYGSGKSHLGLVLANYLTRRSTCPELEMVFRRMAQRDQDEASEMKVLRDNERPFLLVLLEGEYPDGAGHALMLGLRTALKDAGLAEDALRTSYDSALGKMAEWRKNKPHFVTELASRLTDDGRDIAWLEGSLSVFDRSAYQAFKRLHREVTAHEFIPEYNENKVELLRRLSRLLCEGRSHCGIAVIWDQFNEHLQNTSPADLPKEAAFLRSIAEAAERSGQNQLHLVFISHHLPRAYVQDRVSKEALDNWETVQGRFVEHPITAVEDAEELLRDAITKTPDAHEWEEICSAIEGASAVIDRMQELDLYPEKHRNWLVETVFKGGYPLHPLATYCLPRISDVVGQEARTMFTFLEDAESEGGLGQFLAEPSAVGYESQPRFYYADRLFDYFEAAIRRNPETSSVTVEYDEALAKVRDHRDVLTQRTLKSIALLRTIERRHPMIPLASTPAGLSLMLAEEEPRVRRLLETLESNDILWQRGSSGSYDFRTGRLASSFKDDFGKAVRDLGPANVIRALQQRVPARDTLTHEYTDNHGVVRRTLEGAYVRADDLTNVTWREEAIRRKYKDGVVLRVVAESEEDVLAARRAAVAIKNPQVVIAIPRRPLVLADPLTTLAALGNLEGRPAYALEDTQQRCEWKDKFDSAKKTLDSEMGFWNDDARNSTWYSGGDQIAVTGAGESEIADTVMDKVFAKTPRLEHSRIANVRETDQKSDRIKLNTMILDTAKSSVDITKKGGRVSAEMAILEGIFDPLDMLKKQTRGNSICYELAEPAAKPATDIWSVLRKRLAEAGPIADFETLVRELSLPPFGLSFRVIELLVATFMRLNPNRFTVKTRRTKSALAEARELDGQTIHDIVKDPDGDKVIVEYRQKLPREDDYLMAVFEVLEEVLDEAVSPRMDDVCAFFSKWRGRIPLVVLSASDLPERGRAMLEFLERCLGDGDPQELLFKELPLALGIDRELQLWDRGDDAQVAEFKNALREAVEVVHSYPRAVAELMLEALADVFGVRGHAKPDIAAKIENWYHTLDPSVKQASFRGKTPAFLKACNLTASDDIEKRFLDELPRKLGLKAYSDWEDVHSALESLKSMLQSAKVEIDKRQQKVTRRQPLTELPDNAKLLQRSLMESIEKARKKKQGVAVSDIVRILEMLLADFKTRS